MMEARQLLLEMHGPSNSTKDPSNKRYFICQHFRFKGQKHCLNLHWHHGLYGAEAVKEVQLKSYATIPWADPTTSMRYLSRCCTVDDVLKIFRDVKFQSLKKTSGASTLISLTMSERTEKLLKKTAQSEAQLRLLKKSVPIVGTRKRRHKKTRENVAQFDSPSSNFDSFSRSTAGHSSNRRGLLA